MDQYERLAHTAHSHDFAGMVNAAFISIHQYGQPVPRALHLLADRLCAMHGFTAEVQEAAVVFYPAASRAKQPACILVSMSGGTFSPSARSIRHTPLATIQVFDGGADDSDVDLRGPSIARRVETKGRVLLH